MLNLKNIKRQTFIILNQDYLFAEPNPLNLKSPKVQVPNDGTQTQIQ